MTNQLNYGLTAEDLEKAASVRLFEKAAAAEGINLAELSEAQVDELYSTYQQSSEDNTMNDEIIDLFEKQAAYEGVDLESLNDEELAHVYNNFITNLSAAVDAEDTEDTAADYDAEAVNQYLSEKTAHVYNLIKEAEDTTAASKPDAKDGKKAEDAADAAEGWMDKAKRHGGKALDHVMSHKGKYTAGAGVTAGGAYLYNRNKKKKAMEKEAAADTMVSAFDTFLQDNHGVTADDLDEGTFNNAYNEFLDMVANDVVTEQAEEFDAYEKLAEAEILGRHMARSYMDELEKEAGEKVDRAKELLTNKKLREMYNAKFKGPEPLGRLDKASEYARILAGQVDDAEMTSEARKALGAQAGVAAGAVGAGVGGKKMYDRRKEQSKEASILEAQEYLIDQGINPYTGDWLTDYEIYELEKEAGKAKDVYESAKESVKGYHKSKQGRVAKHLKEYGSQAGRGTYSDVKKKDYSLWDWARGSKPTTKKYTPGEATKMEKAKAYAKAYKEELGGGAVLTGGGGLAASKRKKSQEKKASAQIEELAFDRANEFIEFGKEAGFDGSLIDGFAVEILEDNGYDVSPLFE